MAAAISALAKKLGLKSGATAVVLEPPGGVLDLFQPLPEGASVTAGETGVAGATRTPADLVLLFAADAAALEKAFPAARAASKAGGLLWIAYRKGGKKAGTDLNRDILWEHMQRYGLAGVTLVAVDGEWSAMRFRPADEVGK